MDYEKLYKEDLSRARDLHDNHPYGESPTWKTCEEIFPKLNESEDERIRKAIICGMNALKEQHKETFASIPINDCIAWLEKQGQNSAWSEEDENMRQDIISGLKAQIQSIYAYDEQGKAQMNNRIDWLKSIKINHWKPSEEQLKALKDAIIGKRDPLYDLYFDLKEL